MAIKKDSLDLDGLIARVKYTEMSASLRAELLEALDAFRAQRSSQTSGSSVNLQESGSTYSRR